MSLIREATRTYVVPASGRYRSEFEVFRVFLLTRIGFGNSKLQLSSGVLQLFRNLTQEMKIDALPLRNFDKCYSHVPRQTYDLHRLRSPPSQAHEVAVVKVVWAPSEYGDLIACCSKDGTLSIWEEIEDKDKQDVWRLCAHFVDMGPPVLDVQFGNCVSGLKLVAAGGDGHLRVYEASNVLELKHWQLQAEFANVTDVREKLETVSCTAASISWRPAADAIQQPVFVVGFQTNSLQHSIAKVWEFGEAHQRWHVVAELTSPEHAYGRINHVSWAPNIGRPYELIAISSSNSMSIWSMAIPSIPSQRPAVKLLGYFTEHEPGEVLQAEWDMSGMTLASAGSDGVVRLWQSNLKGEWEEKSMVIGTQD